MKLTRQGYNSFSLEGLKLRELVAIADGVFKQDDNDSLAILSYLTNCNIYGAAYSGNPDDVNAIKTREE
jgi:hypothetical protein